MFDFKILTTVLCDKQTVHKLEKNYIKCFNSNLNLNICKNEKKIERKQHSHNEKNTEYYRRNKEHLDTYLRDYRAKRRLEYNEYSRGYQREYRQRIKKS